MPGMIQQQQRQGDPPQQQQRQDDPPRRNPVDLGDPFRTIVRVTMDLNNCVLHNVRDGPNGSGSRPIIPFHHLQPLMELLRAYADVEVCSFVGFKNYNDMAEEGSLCHNSSTVLRQFINHHRVPTTHDPECRRGSFRGLTWVNRKLGSPSWNPRLNGEDTGGKDWRCRIKKSPIIIDDHAGTCAGCADCGITPVIVSSPRHPQAREGLPAFRGFTAAVTHVIALLQSRDSRARLIENAERIQIPRPRARDCFDFADIENAPITITADSFKPRFDDAAPLGTPTGSQS